MDTHGVVKELWVHPIKACRGVSVQRSRFTRAGLVYDRAWAVVDVEGTRHAKMESISQRKLPKLATIATSIVGDQLEIDAPGMPTLRVPLEEDGYAAEAVLQVECSGVSTTAGSGWRLGQCEARTAGKDAESWFTEYLNKKEVDSDKSSKPAARYALARSISTGLRDVNNWAGPKQKESSPFNLQSANVLPGDQVAFQDFAPILISNQSSIEDLNHRMGTHSYPITSFRSNVVMEATGRAWVEEDWLLFEIASQPFRKLKECPRCTVPGRNQTTGDYHFKGGEFDGVKGKLLTPQNTLTKAFPAKAADEEWGNWKGPIFGVYIAPSAESGEIVVGDKLEVTRWRSRGVPPAALIVMLLTILGTLMLPFVLRFLFPAEWQIFLDTMGIVLH